VQSSAVLYCIYVVSGVTRNLDSLKYEYIHDDKGTDRSYGIRFTEKHGHILKISAKNERILLPLFLTIMSSVHNTKMKCLSYHIYIKHSQPLT
jgi:hypothetical protein